MYQAAVAQSRQPYFYAELGVPDSVDGRFEMMTLHCGILVYRLKNDGKTKLSQALFDAMFKSMDPMLREMGVGDLSVPKHMKRMMQGFNGRIINYTQALQNNGKNELEGALMRNVYGTLKEDQVNEENVSALVDYVIESSQLDADQTNYAELPHSESGLADGADKSESGLPDGAQKQGANNVAA